MDTGTAMVLTTSILTFGGGVITAMIKFVKPRTPVDNNKVLTKLDSMLVELRAIKEALPEKECTQKIHTNVKTILDKTRRDHEVIQKLPHGHELIQAQVDNVEERVKEGGVLLGKILDKQIA